MFVKKSQGKILFSVTAIACIMLCFVFSIFATPVKGAKTEVEFMRKQTTQQANELASNMLKVVNGGDKTLKFLLRLNHPEGWKNINTSSGVFEVASGDSLFVPVKLIFKGNEEGDVSYMVVATLISQSNQLQFASASWYVMINRKSDWSASVNKIESFFINNSDTSTFSLNIRNTGNAPELLSVRVTPHFGMQAYDPISMKEITGPFSIPLPPGKDTVLNYLVKLKPVENQYYQNQNSRSQATVSSEKYPLRIAVASATKNNSTGKIWKSTVNFQKTTSEQKYNEYSSQVLPLTAEVRLDNIFENSTIMNINLYGDAKLSNTRNLSYRFQSFFTDQFYNQRSFKGNYHYLGYFTPRASIEAGNITGWGNFGQTPSGEGVKGEYSLGINKIGLLYVQGPTLSPGPTIKGIGARHVLGLKKLSLVNYLQRTNSDFTKSNSLLYIGGLDFKIRYQHIFSLRGGWSTENYVLPTPQISKKGVGGDFNYSGNVKALSFRFSTTYGSKYYTGYRGIFNLNYGINYRINPKYNCSFTNSFYNQDPVYLDQFGNEIGSFKSKSNRYDLSLNVTEKTNGYTVRAAYYDDNYSSFRYITRGLGFDYRPSTKISQVRFYSSVFGSYIKLPGYDIEDYFTAQVRTTFRYHSFNANLRYNYGPYQAYEHLRFATNQVNHQSLYANLFYGFWLLDNSVSLEPSINYSYESLYKRNRFSFRPQLFYFSKSGFEFNVYADYLLNSQQLYQATETTNFQNTEQRTSEQNFTMGVGLKKQFGVPIPGKRFHSVQVVIFKDLNGNLIQDKNEESIENVLVTIKAVTPDSSNNSNSGSFNQMGENLISDANGRVSFKNLPAGIYTITTRPLTENSGWFPVKVNEVVLNKSKELSVPFTQGVRLMGSLIVNHSTSNITRNKTPEFSRIRVTASDSVGRVYSALTGVDGRFELYVPAGDYRISINEKAIDDSYKLVQSMIAVSLSGFSGTYNISFQLNENERKVKIKKFDKEGIEIEQPDKEKQ